MTGPLPAPEVLLEHGDFLRALARRLLQDEHLAEDAVQQTFAQALSSPPRHDGVRAWLATVLRNLVRNSRRADQRRVARERSVAQTSLVPSAEEVHQREAQREALRRQVVHAVLGLPEPYRATVLLRYFEHLSPSEIAKHDGLSASTVRTRLQRGHELLRRRLDDAHRGDRQRWLLAMVPFARNSAPAAAAVSALPLSLLAMKKFAIILAAFVGVLLVYVAVSPFSTTTPAPIAPAAAAASQPAGVVAAKQSADPLRRSATEAAVERTGEVSLPTEFATALAGFRGRVLRADGTPASGCSLQLYRVAMDAVLGADGLASTDAAAEPRLRAGVATTSVDGAFVIDGVRPRGLFVLRCGVGSEEQTTRVVQRAPAPGEVVDLGDLVLSGVAVLTGTVVDDDGTPVADAEVRAVDLPAPFLAMLPLLSFDPCGAVAVRRPQGSAALVEVPPWLRELWGSLPIPMTRTAGDGTFRLAGVPAGSTTLAVAKSGLATATRANVRAELAAVRDVGTVRLGDGEELVVAVTEPDGAPVAGVEVMAGNTNAMQPFDPLRRVGVTDASGTLTAAGFSQGRVTVAVRRGPGHRWTIAPTQRVDRDVEIVLPERFALDVRLVSAAGRALARLSCVVLPSAGAGLPELRAFGATRPLDLKDRLDIGERSLRVRDLPAGDYTLVVAASEHGRVVRQVPLAGDTQIEMALPAPASYRVQVVDARHRPVQRATVYARLRPTAAWPATMPVASGLTDAAGVHVADDLPGRVLEFTASHPAFGVATAVPAGGETTTVVLTAPGAIEGAVVVGGRAPQAGAWMVIATSEDRGLRGAVQPFPLLSLARDDGGFRFPSLQPGNYTLRVTEAFDRDMTLGAVYQFGRYAWMPSERAPSTVEVVAGGTARVTLDAAGADSADVTGSTIRGTLTVDGRPAQGMLVWCDTEGDRAPKPTKVDGRGHYEIRGVDPGRRVVFAIEVTEQSMLDKQPHMMWVGAVEVPKDGAAVRDIDVRTGSIGGVVVGPNGSAAQAWVVLDGPIETDGGHDPADARSQWAVQTGDDGTFEVVNVPAGTYRVRVRPVGGDGLTGTVEDIELGPGASRSDVRVVLAPK